MVIDYPHQTNPTTLWEIKKIYKEIQQNTTIQKQPWNHFSAPKSHISVNTSLFHVKTASRDALAEKVHRSERLLGPPGSLD